MLQLILMKSLDPHYGQAIWTNHALQRLRDRQLDQGTVWLAFQHPDTSSYATSQRTYKYHKIINHQLIEVIAKKNKQGQWLILSCWSKPASQFKPSIPFWESAIKYLWEKIKPAQL